MLSHQAIEERIRDGEIAVTYYFLPGAAGAPTFHPEGVGVDVDASNEASAHFIQALHSDRLNLSLGPVVKSHNQPAFSRRACFGQHRWHTDLRRDGSITLAPNETISIATNERIRLGSRTAALIVPRLTLGDAGILLNVSYIDPFWDGTLQLVITNAAPTGQRLLLLEDVAQCFFFNVEGGAELRFGTEFPAKSHHFGQNWRKVLVDDAEPFPLRKRPVPALGWWARVRTWAWEMWARHKGFLALGGTSLLVILGVYAGWRGIAQPLAQLPETQRKIDELYPFLSKTSPTDLLTLSQSVEELKRQAAVTGLETVTVAQGTSSGERLIEVPAPSPRQPFVLAQTPSATDAAVTASVVSAVSGRITVRLAVRLPTPVAAARDVPVAWALLP